MTSLAAVAITIIAVIALTSPKYEASATLVLTPRSMSSEVLPPAMSIQGFQRLLESDALIDETVTQLIDKGTLGQDDERLDIGDGLRTRIYVSQRSDATTLAPVIELIAQAASAEKAAAIANTWAEVFLSRSHQLQNHTTNANIDLVEAQYQTSDERVVLLEGERLESENRFQAQVTELEVEWRRRIDRATVSWDRKLVEFQAETEDLVTLFQLETRRAIEDSARLQGLAATSAPGPAGQRVGPPTERVGLSLDVETQLLQILTLRIQLAQTLQFLSFEKAISNDALWQSLLLSQNGIVDLETATRPTLPGQAINTVYTTLTEALSDLEVELEQVAKGHDGVARRITGEMERVQRERTASLLQLYAERSQQDDEIQMQRSRELAELSSKRTAEIQALERQHNTFLLQSDRNLTNARSLFEELAGKYNQAELARGALELPEVALAAIAVPRHGPKSRRLLSKATLALVFGAVLGCMSAVLREVKET